MEWTNERVQILKDLWSQGFSASEIADRIGGTSRNAIIGKIHRLGLSSRTEPVQQIVKPMPDSIIATAILPEAIVAPPPAISAPISFNRTTTKQCQWPVGDPRQPGFHFCSVNAHDGLPYCLDHAKVAYQGGLKKRPTQVQAPDENKPRRRDLLDDLLIDA